MAGVLDTASRHSEILTRALVARADCDILIELIILRDEGERSKIVEKYYSDTRAHLALQSSDQKPWVHAHVRAIRNMDKQLRFMRTRRFLDLGCSPGGFSTYALQTCPQARGVGISLPSELGGYDLAIPSDLLPRITVHMADLTNFDLAPSIRKPRSSSQAFFSLPFKPASFDLVLCDAQWVLNPDNLQRAWNWTRLIVSQLLIALRAVSSGGTLFLRLPSIERTLTGRILLALCRVAVLVRCVKADSFQAVRSYFFVLVQRVDTNAWEFKKLVSSLERLWYIMTFEGVEGYGRDITAQDEESITTKEELTSEEGLQKIVQLATPIWEIQYDALCYFLHEKGELQA